MKNVLVTPVATNEHETQLKITEVPSLSEQRKLAFFKAWVTHPIFNRREFAMIDKALCIQMAIYAHYHERDLFLSTISAFLEIELGGSSFDDKKRADEFRKLANDVSRGAVVFQGYINLVRATYCETTILDPNQELDGLDDYCKRIFALIPSTILECYVDLIEQQGFFFKSYMENFNEKID